jgi:hypothetical protein
MKRAPWIAAGAAAAALGAWLLFPHGERGRQAAAAATAPHDAADEKLAALSGRLASLEREAAVRRATVAAPPPAGTADPAAAPDPSGRASAPRPPQHTGDEVYHGLERHFGREAKDPAWSAETEASIAHAFQGGAFAGSTMLRAECGTTICRVDVSHESDMAQNDFLGAVRGAPPFDRGGFAHREIDPDSGQVRTIVYMPRDGQDLPLPDDG